MTTHSYSLANKHILLGITGSIAAYKAADLTRRLREVGAIVRIVMTDGAKEFITPLTLQALSGYPVYDNLFDLQAEAAMGHIELARWADIILIAPASANCVAHLAHGFADDLLTTLYLASRAPIFLVPAMNVNMWQNAITQENVKKLIAHNINILGPETGLQACGAEGFGRMLESINIINFLENYFKNKNNLLLKNIKILITAGPTHEPLDPIRYISNYSSGKMGFALAEAAKESGANVHLISGPVNLSQPAGVDLQSVITAQEMHESVMQNINTCDIFISVAAVGDYYCKSPAEQKISKQETENPLSLVLEKTADIIESVGKMQKKIFIVGFAAETEDLIIKAKLKKQRKKMNLIIANNIANGQGMGSDENAVTVITQDKMIEIPKMTKKNLTRKLIAIIAEYFYMENMEKKCG